MHFLRGVLKQPVFGLFLLDSLMLNHELAEQIVKMIYDGGSVYRNGNYDLPSSSLLNAIEDIIDGGDGHLKEHDTLFWMIDFYEDSIMAPEDAMLFESALKNKNFWNIYTMHGADDIEDIRCHIEHSTRLMSDKAVKERRRAEACRYTARKDIRLMIFQRDGKVCKPCGSTTNLTLDHIIPVAKGGEDSPGNMQVLCRSCNSKKG